MSDHGFRSAELGHGAHARTDDEQLLEVWRLLATRDSLRVSRPVFTQVYDALKAREDAHRPCLRYVDAAIEETHVLVAGKPVICDDRLEIA